jgi:hypothetical protein
MKSMRKQTLLRTILECLRFAQGYAVLEEALRPQVDALMRPPTTEEEWEGAIKDLSHESRGAIVAVESGLDKELVQWAITERGRVLLATL